MFKVFLKFAFASAIIYWLLRSGKLDFSLVAESIKSGHTWLLCITLIIIQDIGSALRWKLLLQVNNHKKLPFIALARVTWIGLFFNSVLPGIVTGDIIKLVYARDLNKDLSKTFLVTTVVMDRIIGLIGLLTLLGFFSILNYQNLVSLGPQMKTIVHFNFMLFAGVIFFIFSLFLHKRFQKHILELTRKIPLLGDKITETLTQVWLIGENKKTVFQCLFISIVLQFVCIVAFWVITSPFYGKPVPFQYLFTFVPLGFMAVAVPISPSGLGVGHVIFEELFSYINIDRGASLFNLYFLCLVFVNLLGFFPYLLSSKKHSLEESTQFAEQ